MEQLNFSHTFNLNPEVRALILESIATRDCKPKNSNKTYHLTVRFAIEAPEGTKSHFIRDKVSSMLARAGIEDIKFIGVA